MKMTYTLILVNSSKVGTIGRFNQDLSNFLNISSIRDRTLKANNTSSHPCRSLHTKRRWTINLTNRKLKSWTTKGIKNSCLHKSGKKMLIGSLEGIKSNSSFVT